MRWNSFFLLLALAVCIGCSKGSPDKMTDAKISGHVRERADAANEEAVSKKAEQGAPNAPGQPPKGAEPADKKEKPRKIRYTADMKLIVEKIDEAEEALDAARDKADGEYEKVEVNRSANVVRSGLWRVRVPVKNLTTFRKAVAKIGEVERDTIDSDDITAKYYDLERHIANRKAHEKAVREFLVEIGKKDPRYTEVWRELAGITDDIDRQEGMLKLWANMTDRTTFTIHLREKEPYSPPVVKDKQDPPAFSDRASTAWEASWDVFLSFCQRVTIIAIWVAPWLPIVLVVLGCLWLIARRLARASPPKAPVVLAPAESKTA